MNATTHQRQRAVRIEIGAEARSYVSEGQRVTLVPLTIKRRQNRKLLPASARPCTASATLSSADRPGKTLVIW